MSLAALKLTERGTQQESEPVAPSTPRKKPKYPEEQLQTKRKVKSITKLIEKQSTNFMYPLLVLVWTLFVCGAILMSFQAKIKEAQISAIKQIEKCSLDFEINRCDNPVKGAIHFCSQKLACIREDPKTLAERKISYSGIFGQIGQEFINGAGIYGVALGVLLIWLCLRKKGLNRTITSVQYYQNQ